MHRERRNARVLGVDAQRDLLRHRAARHEHRGLDAEECRDLRLEIADERTFAVAVGRVAVRLHHSPAAISSSPGSEARHAGNDERAAPPQRGPRASGESGALPPLTVASLVPEPRFAASRS